MRKLIVAVLFLLAIQLIGCAAPLVKVESGEKVVCLECGKLIRSDVQTKMVKQELASNFAVREIKELCDECRRKKAEAARLAEERRIAEARRQSRGRVAGEWIWQNPLGNIILLLRSDGTGRLYDYIDLKWQPTSDGFRANCTEPGDKYKPARTHSIYGRLISGGSELLVEGYGVWGFGSGNMVFRRMN